MDPFFACNKTSQAFDIEELEITASEDVAFAVAVTMIAVLVNWNR